MTEDRDNTIKTEIIDKCRLLEKLGYFIGTWGTSAFAFRGPDRYAQPRSIRPPGDCRLRDGFG
jgi:hypothetical protein